MLMRMTGDPELDRLYLPTTTTPNVTDYFDQWAADSARARAAHPPETLAYGSGQHETLDIFTAENATRTVLFIHGGYWRAFYKDHFSYLAPAILEDGYRLAVVSYDLCPAVTLTDIVAQVQQACLAVARAYADPIVVTGNSAGGHLAAILHSTDWAALGESDPGIVGAVGMSGLYELAPLRRTSLQETIALTDTEVLELSPARRRPTTSAPFLAVYGGEESEAFGWQSTNLAEHWGEVVVGPRSLPGHNHFTITDDLAVLVREVEGLSRFV